MSDRHIRAAAAATGATLHEVSAVFDQVALWRRYGIELSLSDDGAHVAVRFPSGVSDESREAVRSFVREHKAALLILVANEDWRSASQVSDEDYDYAANYEAGKGMVDLLTHNDVFLESLGDFLLGRAAWRYARQKLDLDRVRAQWAEGLREVPPPEPDELPDGHLYRELRQGPDEDACETVVSCSLASAWIDPDPLAGMARFDVDARAFILQLEPTRPITGAKLTAWVTACEEPVYAHVAEVLDANYDQLLRNFMWRAAHLSSYARGAARAHAQREEARARQAKREEAKPAPTCSPEHCGIDQDVSCIVETWTGDRAETCGAALRHHSSGCRQPLDPDCLEKLDGASPEAWHAYRARAEARRREADG